jgi:hypothetical protein
MYDSVGSSIRINGFRSRFDELAYSKVLAWHRGGVRKLTLYGAKNLILNRPFFPGALFLLSSWYTKKELALRTSILYSGSLLSGAFGGLIGASIENYVHNFLGISSWR